jgi:hypothetical protein
LPGNNRKGKREMWVAGEEEGDEEEGEGEGGWLNKGSLSPSALPNARSDQK